MNEKVCDEQTEFEKRLLQELGDRTDANAMELISILRRKLQMRDHEHGASNLNVLEGMLEKEPLHKFILFAKKYYCSNEVF